MQIDPTVVWWMVAGSVVMFLASLFAIPVIIVRLPADYFCYPRRHPVQAFGFGAFVYYAWLVGKNIAGIVFIFMGIAMLVLPGQGIISILIGLSLTNFPGKYRLEQFLVHQKVILQSLNWIRHRAGKSSFFLEANPQPKHPPRE